MLIIVVADIVVVDISVDGVVDDSGVAGVTGVIVVWMLCVVGDVVGLRADVWE